MRSSQIFQIIPARSNVVVTSVTLKRVRSGSLVGFAEVAVREMWNLRVKAAVHASGGKCWIVVTGATRAGRAVTLRPADPGGFAKVVLGAVPAFAFTDAANGGGAA